MNNEQLFELLTKMYSEMKKGFGTVDARLNGVENEISGLMQKITKINLTLENDINPKLDALLDGYKQLAEGQKEIKKDIQALSERQDNQELQIKVLKGIAK